MPVALMRCSSVGAATVTMATGSCAAVVIPGLVTLEMRRRTDVRHLPLPADGRERRGSLPPYPAGR